MCGIADCILCKFLVAIGNVECLDEMEKASSSLSLTGAPSDCSATALQ